MYLTSQRVVTKDGETGINTFFHLHTSGIEPQLKSILDIISVAESNTGNLITSLCEIAPGGNRVKSYLDIVAQNNTGIDIIEDTLNKFRSEVEHAQVPSVTSLIGKIGIRFNAEFGLYDMTLIEYDTLMKRALSFFQEVIAEKQVLNH